MASKLTTEQKAINKKATKLRDRAYHQRMSTYRADLDAADTAFASSDTVRATEEADEAFNKAINDRKAALADISEQIAAMKQKLAETEREYGEILEPLKAARNVAWDARRKEEQALKDGIRAKYPDVADCWSAAAWKPFEEFLPLVQNG